MIEYVEILSAKQKLKLGKVASRFEEMKREARVLSLPLSCIYSPGASFVNIVTQSLRFEGLPSLVSLSPRTRYSFHRQS